jgi:hypothetical protein
MIRRKFTPEESTQVWLLALQIRRDVDEQLGRLLQRLANGDDSVLPGIHDRLNVIGRPEVADRLHKLIFEE